MTGTMTIENRENPGPHDEYDFTTFRPCAGPCGRTTRPSRMKKKDAPEGTVVRHVGDYCSSCYAGLKKMGLTHQQVVDEGQEGAAKINDQLKAKWEEWKADASQAASLRAEKQRAAREERLERQAPETLRTYQEWVAKRNARIERNQRIMRMKGERDARSN